MVVIFIALFIIVCSFNFFMMAYQMNGINRLFYSVPIALIESSIDQYDLSLENAPHFIKETLENKLTSYFEFSLKNYVDNFTLNFYYYNPSDYSFCTSDNCSAFEATLKTDLILNYHYEKTLFYEIRSSSWMSKN